jgi:hypothetical protein
MRKIMNFECKLQPWYLPSRAPKQQYTNAVPKTAEAKQQTRTPCNAAQQVVKLVKMQSSLSIQYSRHQRLSPNSISGLV